jgi:hypothetical protein
MEKNFEFPRSGPQAVGFSKITVDLEELAGFSPLEYILKISTSPRLS